MLQALRPPSLSGPGKRRAATGGGEESGILVLHVGKKQQKLYIYLIFLQYIELAWI